MTKNATAIATEALRRIRVIASDETPASVDLTYVEAQWDALFEELDNAPHSFGYTWTVDTVPDNLFRPIAWLLATDIAQHYARNAEPRARALMRLRETKFVDDREDRADLDDDGTVTDEEQDAADYGLYY